MTQGSSLRAHALVGLGACILLFVPLGARQKSPGAGAIVVLETARGNIEFETYPDEAPKTVGRVTELVKQHFYDGQRFHRAEPWQLLANEDVLTLEFPGIDKLARAAIVMGNGGMQFGVALYPSREAAEEMIEDDGRLRARSTYWSMTFSLPEEVPMPDGLLWEEENLALANPDAYPLVIGYAPGDRVLRPSHTLLRSLTTIVSALAETSEQEMDTGRWRKIVDVAGDRVEVDLALPGLMEGEDADAATRRAGGARPRLHDPRANERIHSEIGRFLESKAFASLEEANAAMREQFTGRRDVIPSTASTPLERAQELCYQAFESVGRRRVVLARQALALSADCADAYVIQAEFVATPDRALPLYRAGVEAGSRALAAAPPVEDGSYWSRVDTRPYMRARLGVADSLAALGRIDETIPEYQALLDLNPNDNQGVRYLLLASLLGADRVDDAQRLLAKYPEDASASWMFTWALLEFKAGRREEADARLAKALEWNELVAALLHVPVEDLPRGTGTVTLGGPDEAVEYAKEFGAFWRETEGALEWIAAMAGKAKRSAGAGARKSKRKRSSR